MTGLPLVSSFCLSYQTAAYFKSTGSLTAAVTLVSGPQRVTTRSRVRDKLIVVHLVKKFAVFMVLEV
jgi:hypothetical protein